MPTGKGTTEKVQNAAKTAIGELDVNQFFNTEGAIPVPRFWFIVSTLIGSIFLGGIWGVIEFINGIYGGVFSTFEGFGAWLSKLVDGFFNIGVDPLGAAFAANAEFLEAFGAWGQAVAALEVAALVWLLWWSAQLVGSAITGGNS